MWTQIKEEQALSQGWNLFVINGSRLEVQKADFPEECRMNSYQKFGSDREAMFYVSTTAHYGMPDERHLCLYAMALLQRQHES